LTAPPRPLTARTATVTAGAQMAARALTVLLTAASVAVITRAVGEDGFADWGTILMLTAMVAFVLDPGIGSVVVRRLAQGGTEAPAPASLLATRLVLAGAAYAAIVALTLALRGEGALALALVLGAQLLPRAVTMNVGTWLQAEHRLHIQTILEAVVMAIGLAALGVAVAMGAGRTALAACGFLAPAVLLAVAMLRAGAHLPSRRGREPHEERAKVRSVLREAAPLAVAILLVSVYTRINVVFVNEAEDVSGLAGFTFAFLFIEQLFVVSAIVAGTLLPMFSERARRVSLARDRGTLELVWAVALLGAAASLVLMAAAKPLVLLLGGSEFEHTDDLLRLLAPTAVALFLNMTLAYMYVAVERASAYLRYNLVGLALSIALGATFTANYGADAAARVSWITELTVATLAAVMFFGRSPEGRRALVRIGAVVAVVIACSELSSSGGVAGVVATALAAVAVVGAGVRLVAAHGIAARALRRSLREPSLVPEEPR